MKGNEVIKALECCSAPVMRCDECPVDKAKKAVCECGTHLAGEALKVINELIENLERHHTLIIENILYTSESNKTLAEIYLKVKNIVDERDRYKRYYFNHEYDKMEAEVRADTVRKMQDSIVVHFGTYTTEDYVRVLDVIRVISLIGEELLSEGGD